MAGSDLVGTLARVPLFSKLDPKALERLARGMKETTFDAGHQITSEGEGPGVGFYVIEEGSATVTVGGETVDSLGPGESFGEMALIDGGPRSATVTADSELRCVGMSAWEFRPFFNANPEVAWPMLEALVARIREAESR
jgi:CRP-like cAMP-binding protein